MELLINKKMSTKIFGLNLVVIDSHSEITGLMARYIKILG